MCEEASIGIDLGGTQVRAALIENGVVLRRAAARTDVKGGPTAVLRQFKHLIAAVCDASEKERVVGVGISAPGPLDSETGTVLRIPTLPGWENFPLREALASDLRLPVVLENDGIAAAFGEWRYGAGRGLQHLVYVTVSTGIGGGVVADGRLLHGRRGMAAHVGHFRMAFDGPVCSCGTAACFEAFAAGSALGLRARSAAAAHPESLLSIWSASEPIGAPHVVEGARRGDAICVELLDQEALYLGIGFTGLIHLFSPERIIMGGGVSRAFDLLRDGIHAVICRDAMEPFKDVPVVPAGLGDNAGLVGAASLVIESLDDQDAAKRVY